MLDTAEELAMTDDTEEGVEVELVRFDDDDMMNNSEEDCDNRLR